MERLLQLQNAVRRRLHALRLTPNLAGALLFLQRCPGAHAMAVWKALAIAPSSSTPIIYGLVRKGWVVRIRPSDNYRAVVLRLTPRGEKVASAIARQLGDMPHIGTWS